MMSTTSTRSGTRLRGPLSVVLTLTLMSLITSAFALSPPHTAASAATGDAGITIDGSEADWIGNPEVVAKTDPCETTGDKNDDDSFKGGTKLGSIIFGGGYEIVTQSVPKKDDLCVARAAYEFDDDDHVVLFVSWHRAGNTGTASVYIPFGDTDGVLEPGEFVLRYSHDSSAGHIRVASITTPDGSSLAVADVDSYVDAAIGPDGYFAETSVDLTAAGLVPDDPCLTVVAPFMATETGREDTNPDNDEMMDFVNIPDLVITGCGTVTIVKEVLGEDATFPFEGTFVTGDPPAVVGAFEVPTTDGTGTVLFDPVKPTEGDETYSIAEDLTGLTDWTRVSATCTDGTNSLDPTAFTVDRGEDIVCTFVNGQAPTLTLTKTVENRWGGTAEAGDFSATIDGEPIAWATEVTFPGPGTHTIAEGSLNGYAAGDWACSGATGFDPDTATVTIGWGDTASCAIVNSDQAASLTLLKTVVNDDKGTADADDFTLLADGPTPISGAGSVAGTVAAGTYTLSETGPAGYSDSGWTCEGGTLVGDQLTLGLGASAVCTITNDDLEPPPAPEPPEVDLSVEKTDFDVEVVLTEDQPVGEIAYEVTVTNAGPDAATGVVVTDTLPTTTMFVSASASQGSCTETGGVVTCDLGELAVGATATLEVVVTTEALGSLTVPVVENVAVVDGSRPDPNPANNEAREDTPISEVFPVLLPNVTVDKVDLVDPIVLTEDDPDGEITYVVTVANAADAGPATDVVVVDTLPDTVVLKSAVPDVGACSVSGQVLTCSLGDLGPGDEVGITITVATESFGELTVGTVTNTAQVLVDGTPFGVDDETTDIAEVKAVLPVTGFDDGWLVGVGALALVLGSVVLLATRRRDEEVVD